MLPFLLKLCVCPEGLSRPLSSPVSAVTSSTGPPVRGLLWAGGNSSLCVGKGEKDFRSQIKKRINDPVVFPLWWRIFAALHALYDRRLNVQ